MTTIPTIGSMIQDVWSDGTGKWDLKEFSGCPVAPQSTEAGAIA